MSYYKVLRACNKQLYSGNGLCNYITRYIKNKWTHPLKNASQFLFVFDTLDNAKCWAGKDNIIYECEVGKILATCKNIKGVLYSDGMNFNRYEDNYYYIDGILQQGTILVDKVKITKKVK